MEQDIFRSLFHSSEPDFVLEMAENALRDESSKRTPWVAVAASRAAGLLRRWQTAAEWAERGLRQRSLDNEARAWLHYFGGTASIYLGDVRRSERELRRVEELGHKVPGLALAIAKARFNLGILMHMSGQLEEHRRYIQQAADGFGALGITAMVVRCRLEIAWSYLLAGFPLQAHAELVGTETEIAGQSDEELSLNFSLAMALYHSLQGDIDKSTTLCQEILASPTDEIGLKAEAAWIMGCNCKASGHWEEAVDFANEAHHYAWMDFWQPRIERIEALRGALRRH